MSAAARPPEGHAAISPPARTIPIKLVQPPPTPREMLCIAAGLTLVCFIAGLILAFCYALTQPAKEHNQHLREMVMIRQLLGLAADARVEEVRRYMHWRGHEPDVVYLLPDRLLTLDTAGHVRGRIEVPAAIAGSPSTDARDQWARQAAKASEENFKFSGRFFVGREPGSDAGHDPGHNSGGRPRSDSRPSGHASGPTPSPTPGRLAGYVVEGTTPGYKTWIRFFLALDADFRLRGLEVVQHEEDPGLGAEITQRYFKNQFAGRSLDEVAALEVTKAPLPAAWRKSVEELGGISFAEWFRHHAPELQLHPNIHAITGSTISSAAVTEGVKTAVRNFRNRMTTVGQQL